MRMESSWTTSPRISEEPIAALYGGHGPFFVSLFFSFFLFFSLFFSFFLFFLYLSLFFSISIFFSLSVSFYFNLQTEVVAFTNIEFVFVSLKVVFRTVTVLFLCKISPIVKFRLLHGTRLCSMYSLLHITIS